MNRRGFLSMIGLAPVAAVAAGAAPTAAPFAISNLLSGVSAIGPAVVSAPKTLSVTLDAEAFAAQVRAVFAANNETWLQQSICDRYMASLAGLDEDVSSGPSQPAPLEQQVEAA